MPELPEVETVVRDLQAADIVDIPIVATDIFWGRTVLPNSPDQFAEALVGSRLCSLHRRAKYIVGELDSGKALIGHLRMSGRLDVVSNTTPVHTHERMRIVLQDKRALQFIDPRKFGRWYVGNAQELESKLGPEPFAEAFTPEYCVNWLATTSRPLKTVLLDQTFVAGIGNIYADEALFLSRLHPLRPASGISVRECARLHAAIIAVLQRGIDNMGTTLGTGAANFYSTAGRKGSNQDGLQVFRRTGLPCPVCRRPITRLVVGQRSTHCCEHCQIP